METGSPNNSNETADDDDNVWNDERFPGLAGSPSWVEANHGALSPSSTIAVGDEPYLDYNALRSMGERYHREAGLGLEVKFLSFDPSSQSSPPLSPNSCQLSLSPSACEGQRGCFEQGPTQCTDRPSHPSSEKPAGTVVSGTIASSSCANWWVMPLVQELDRLNESTNPDKIFSRVWDGELERYGSDCSGVDAPFRGMEAIAAHLKTMGITYPLKNLFGSECVGPKGEAARKFMALNGPPEVLFDDMTARDLEGPDHYSGKQVETPANLTWYTAGFVCVDQCSENVTHRKPLQSELTASSGESTKTLLAAIRYIRHFRPARFLLENPYKKKR